MTTKSSKKNSSVKLLASHKTSPAEKTGQAIVILSLMYEKYLERVGVKNAGQNI